MIPGTSVEDVDGDGVCVGRIGRRQLRDAIGVDLIEHRLGQFDSDACCHFGGSPTLNKSAAAPAPCSAECRRRLNAINDVEVSSLRLQSNVPLSLQMPASFDPIGCRMQDANDFGPHCRRSVDRCHAFDHGAEPFDAWDRLLVLLRSIAARPHTFR
jgi:hypothetical protein